MRIFSSISLPLLPLLFSPVVSAIGVPDAPHLVTQGQSEIRAQPDMATLSVSVTALQEESRTAKEEVDTKVAALFSSLAGLGIGKEDIDSGNVITRPDYRYPGNGAAPELRGYLAERQISVRLHDLDVLSQALNKILEQGIQNIQQISYGLQNEEEVRRQARQEAIAEARSLAEELAAGFGRALDDVYAIEYQPQGPVLPRPMGMMAKAASAESLDATYVQNEIQFHDSVQVVFTLK
jgi:hypothetical protein